MDIPLTDGAQTSIEIEVRDDSPLAKARPSQLLSAGRGLLGEIKRPIDQVDFGSVSLGFSFKSPSALIADTAVLTIKAGTNSTLRILRPSDTTVFPVDAYSLAVPIRPNECWIGIELTSLVEPKIGTTFDGFGVALSEQSEISTGYYQPIPAKNGIFPSLNQAFADTLSEFRIASHIQDVLNQPAGTVVMSDAKGTVKLTGSYTIPLAIQPLASIELPFHYDLEISPAAEMKISGELSVSGQFRFRCYKKSATEIELSLYKKRATSLTAALSVVAGLQLDDRGATLLDVFLSAVLPGVDLKSAGVPALDKKAFQDLVKQSVDRSLTMAINLACVAAEADQTAMSFLVDLTGDQTQTAPAIQAALGGDWTLLTKIPNAKCTRNVIGHSEESKHQLRVNLFGFYNTASVTDYVKSCTMVRDETGQITLIDKAMATRMSLASEPYAAEPDRLRRALAESFLATVTYAVTRSGSVAKKLGAEIVVQQSYFRFDNKWDLLELKHLMLLGRALGLIDRSEAERYLANATNQGPIRVTATASYDIQGSEALFFSEISKRSLRRAEDLELVGRQTLASLIDSDEPVGRIRLWALQNDPLWSQMNKLGNAATFSTIEEVSPLAKVELAAISTDWTAVRWWTDSMVAVGQRLSQVLAVLDRLDGADPFASQEFEESRKSLLDELKTVAKNTHAAFAEGWGLAVMHALTRSQAPLALDIAFGAITRHYGANPTLGK
jgi:hypothetical protein